MSCLKPTRGGSAASSKRKRTKKSTTKKTTKTTKTKDPVEIKTYSFKYLDKNKDGFVSIDEFLMTHRSLGPKASPGKIEYDYQDWNNFMRFFLLVMKQEKKLQLVCLPEVKVALKRFPMIRFRAAMMIYLKEKSSVAPPTLIRAIQNCQQQGIRFIAVSLMIFPHERTGWGHQNLILIDLKKKTMERFDPYGQKTTFQKNDHGIIKQIIQEKLLEPLDQALDLQLKYLSPQLISPFQGPQTKGDAFCGMCITFTMMYLHLRLLNPDIPQKKIVTLMNQGGKKAIQDRVLRYARYVEDTLKGKRA